MIQETLFTLEVRYPSPLTGTPLKEEVYFVTATREGAGKFGLECQNKIWKLLGNVSVTVNIVGEEPVTIDPSTLKCTFPKQRQEKHHASTKN